MEAIKGYVNRYLVCVLFLLAANCIRAQQANGWEDPYIQPGAPGVEELEKAWGSYNTTDFESARRWYEISANKGNLFAYTQLARMLIQGEGGPVDIPRGLECVLYAAHQGYPLAMLHAGFLYSDGIYVTRDLQKAFEYYKLYTNATEDTLGKVMLGNCYAEGLGTSKDVAKGIELLKEAALLGNSIAQRRLGNIYQFEVDYRDEKEAVKWYTMAAANSEWGAQNNLALMYAKGEGVEINFAKAHSLINEAKNAVSRSSMNSEEQSYAQAMLLDSDGEIYLMENKMEEATAIWNQLKTKYPEYIEDYKFSTGNVFVRTMYKHEQEEQKALASKNDHKQTPSAVPSIISDVDEKIPENGIVETPTFAVIIANENYKEVEGVPYAVRDGEIFKQYCEKTLGIPKNNVKFEKDATFNTIKRQLSWLGQVMDVYQGEANIIFYYAGHGIPDEANRSAYLLPVDGYGSDVATGYSLDKLYADLSEKPAKSVVVLLDACFSGAKRDGGMLASVRGVAIKAKQNAPKGNMVVFSAAQGDETAYPYKEKGHGMFTYYLMKKLQETKGNVTFGELADYVTTEVKKQSIVVNGKMQTPLVSSSSSVTDWQNWKLR